MDKKSRKKIIPVCEPVIGKDEIKNVLDCLKTGWISSNGRYIEEFEEKWAKYCGRKYGIAVSNGTVALQLAVGCLGLAPGSEIIIPDFTIISCALAAVYNNLMPVFVDADPEIWTIDVDRIEEKITKKTRAIMPVHIYGHPCDMAPILELAARHNLKIIEDAAEAHGAEYKSRMCGSFGDISCFSFYANKIITTGEGGMIMTDNMDLAERARSMRNLCFKNERRFYHTEPGNNFRFTNIQAAIGVAQLERIEEFILKKRRMAEKYTERLANIKGLQLPVEKKWARNVYWMYGVVLEKSTGFNASEFAKALLERGVMTRPFFLGMHEQPVLHDLGISIKVKYPVSEKISRQGLYLPSGLTLTEKQIGKICSSVADILA